MNPQDSTPKSNGHHGMVSAPNGSLAQGHTVDGLRNSVFVPVMPQNFGDANGSSSKDGSPSVAVLWQAFRRRWVAAVVAGVLGAVAVILLVLFVFPAQYPAIGKIRVKFQKDAGFFVQNQSAFGDFQVFKAFQMDLVKSPHVIQRALNAQTQDGRPIRDLAIVRESSDPIGWLKNAIRADNINLAPETVRVTLSADRNDEVAVLLNAILDAYYDENREREEQKFKGQLDDLSEKLRITTNDLALKRRLLAEREGPGGKYRADFDLLLEDLKGREKDLAQTNLEQIRSKTEVSFLQKQIQSPGDMQVSDADLDDALRNDLRAQSLLKDINRKNAEIDLYLRNSVNPDVGTLEADRRLMMDQYKRLRDSLRPEIERKMRSKHVAELNTRLFDAKTRVATLEQQEIAIKDRMVSLREKVRAIAPLDSGNIPIDVATLKDQTENLSKQQIKLNDTIAGLKNEVRNNLRVSIEERAVEPSQRDVSKQIKLAGAGGVGMFGLLVLIVSFMESRTRRISFSSDINEGLGLNVIGTVPAMPKASPGSKVRPKQMEMWEAQLTESIDTIRTQMLHASRNDATRVVLVSSAIPGEGKSSLASQLAASLARAWRKVLLIDGDLRNPSAHRLFEMPREPGLSEVLRGEATAADAIRSTALSRLWMMPAGHGDAHAVQALAQDNVRTLLEQLKQQYDFIVIDSAPILPVNDTLLLAQNVDSVVFSIMRNVSRAPQIQEARRRLENVGARTMGAVVLGVQNEFGSEAYGEYTLFAQKA
ncbi:MAG: polysaccharide biosynthesis tyrosine autokinase [Gemmataceae bacterium]|nr:polysaccharide biosynthesis tyrosine autokinase [Gemmataceae bacterium]